MTAGLVPLTSASLCAGYLGLDDAAAALLGTRLLWCADNDTGPSKLIAHNHPGLANYGDLTAIDWRLVPYADVWTAGFPCTDVSLAGPRGGMLTGSRSGVWFHIAEGIKASRPSIIMIENTRGLLHARADSNLEHCPGCMGDPDREPRMRALGAVLGALADLGFDAEWCCVPASGTGACHQRDRVFALAWHRSAADPDSPVGRQWRLTAARQAAGWRARANARGLDRALDRPVADPRGVGLERLRGNAGPHPEWPAADGGGHGLAGGDPRAGFPWGRYGPAIARHELVHGRQHPWPVDPGRTGDRLAPRFVEWMMCLAEGRVTGVPGLSRTEQLMLLGNGVVPAQATWAFAHLFLTMAEATGVLTPTSGRRTLDRIVG
jgi:DNA (cytosine-5)-methyltransferase 1